MDSIVFQEILQELLSAERIVSLCKKHGIIERQRKLDIVALVQSLVLSTGSDDSGRLADAHQQYQSQSGYNVVRGAYYAWMTPELAALMRDMLDEALAVAGRNKVILRGPLATVLDWILVDSETITLRKSAELKKQFPATHKGAGLKVHKEYSLGKGVMVSYRLSPSRENDAKKFVIDERLRGQGIIGDLAYLGLKRLREAKEHGVSYVFRLKDNWQPQLTSLDESFLRQEFFVGMNFRFGVAAGWISLDGITPIDADVTVGQGRWKVSCRMVGVPGPDGYHFYLTNLPRKTHRPQDVSDLYRCRWEIEIDNKLDKGGGRLDQVQVKKRCSAEILIYAGLLHSMLANMLTYRDRAARLADGARPQAPLHRQRVANTLRAKADSLIELLMGGNPRDRRWASLARTIDSMGRDPNWRCRPSILDRLLGLTAPPGRGRKQKLSECPPSARSYYRVAPPLSLAV